MAEKVPKELLDVASVSLQGGPFGSGRLIAPGLVLTAGHTVDYPPAAPAATGWCVRLLGQRSEDGTWRGDPYEAKRIWRGLHVDLALLKIGDGTPQPAFDPVFCSLVGEIDGLETVGYPQATWDTENAARDYRVRGCLRKETVDWPFAFIVPIADVPKDVTKWKGMSGAVVVGRDPTNRIRIFGAVQSVEERFVYGKLYVERIEAAFADPLFLDTLEEALGEKPTLVSAGLPTPEEVRARVREHIDTERKKVKARLGDTVLNKKVMDPPPLQGTPGVVRPMTSPPSFRSYYPGLFARRKPDPPGTQNFDDFESAFHHFDQRVLLLGAPGAGKTTVLLDFGLRKIEQWERNPEALVPVFAPIYTWERNRSIIDWLAETGTPMPGGEPFLDGSLLREMIKQQRLLLLLDGLDELCTLNPEHTAPADLRIEFMNALAREEVTRSPTVVSCRIEDYQEIVQKSGEMIALNGAVTLEPFGDDQIREYLRDHPGLLTVLESDRALRDLASNPFVLAALTVGYSDNPLKINELEHLKQSSTAFQNEIIHNFVRECFRLEKLRLAVTRNELPPCAERGLYEIFGRVACEILGGGLQLSLGEARVSMAEPRTERDGGEAPGTVEIDIATLRSLLGSRTPAFTAFALSSHLLVRERSRKLRFAHALVRDHFARSFLDGLEVSHTQPAVRRSAIGVLGLIRDVQSIDRLIYAVDDNDEGNRLTAVWCLGQIGDRRGIEPLVRSLRRPERILVAMSKIMLVVEALGKIGPAAASAVVGILEHLDEFFADAADDKIRVTIPRFHLSSNCVKMLGRLGDPGIDGLVGLLSHRYEYVRELVITTLGETKDPRAFEPLVEILGVERRGVIISAAAGALGKSGDTRAVQPLIAALKHSDLSTRCAAARALGRLGDKTAIVPLLSVSIDDLRVRYAVNDALKALGYETSLLEQRLPSLDLLTDALRSEEDNLRNCAICALGEAGTPTAVELLITAFGDLTDPTLRANAARELSTIGGERAIELLLTVLQDSEPRVRMAAVDLFARIRDARAVCMLIEALSDPEREVRERATRGLSQAGAAAIGPLLDALRNENKAPQAVTALVQIGEPAVEPLLTALRDEGQSAQGFAVSALVGIGKPAGEPLIRLLDDEDRALRALAARALKLMRDVRAVRPLINIAQDDNEDLQIEAIRALVAIGEPAAESCLDALLRRATIPLAVAFGLIGSVAVVDRLAETLQNPANEARFCAALALGEIGDTRAVAPLIAALGDPNADFRTVAAAGLGKLGDARAIAPLAAALNDPEDDVRKAAADALKDIKLVLIAPLTDFLEDENDTVRAIATQAVKMLPS